MKPPPAGLRDPPEQDLTPNLYLVLVGVPERQAYGYHLRARTKHLDRRATVYLAAPAVLP